MIAKLWRSMVVGQGKLDQGVVNTPVGIGDLLRLMIEASLA